MWPLISAGSWRSSAITATPSSSPGAASANDAQRLEPERAGVVVGPHRRRSRARRSARRAAPRPRGRAPPRLRSRERSSPRRPPRTRRAASAGTCRPASRGAAYIRPRRSEPRSAPASSGCRRRRRSAAPRTRAAAGRSSSRGPSAAGRRSTTSGLPASLEQRRDPEPGVGADEAGVGDPVERRVRLRVGDRLGDALEAPDLARPRGEREADRADPAEEVEEPLAAAEPGELAGDRVQPLGHLGVGLQEGVVGDAEAQPAELLGQVLGAEHPGRPVGAAGRPLDHGVQVDRRARDLRRRGDQPGLELAGAPALADDEVAQRRRSVARSRRRGGARRAPTRGPRCGRRCWPAEASLQSSTSTISAQLPRRWKPSASRVGAGAERVLELVAVAPRLERGLDRLELEALEAAEAAQRVGDLLGLLGELALVGQPLPRRAGAGLAVVDAGVGDPLGARARAARPRLPSP